MIRPVESEKLDNLISTMKEIKLVKQENNKIYLNQYPKYSATKRLLYAIK